MMLKPLEPQQPVIWGFEVEILWGLELDLLSHSVVSVVHCCHHVVFLLDRSIYLFDD